MSADPVYLVGAGGHGKVVADSLAACDETLRVVDADPALAGATFLRWSVQNEMDVLDTLAPGARFFVAVGDSRARRAVFDRWLAAGHRPETVVHPSAVVSEFARLGRNVCVLAGAVVQADSTLGDGTIVNTAATVDHDCRVGDFAHIAPGVHVAGDARIGSGSWIGVGAVIREKATIGENALIGAGSLVLQDVPSGVIAYGHPCQVRQELAAR